MTIVRRLTSIVLITLFCQLLIGCQNVPKFSEIPKPELPDVRKMRLMSPAEMMHELKPHRLHRWNRHTPPNRSSDW